MTFKLRNQGDISRRRKADLVSDLAESVSLPRLAILSAASSMVEWLTTLHCRIKYYTTMAPRQTMLKLLTTNQQPISLYKLRANIRKIIKVLKVLRRKSGIQNLQITVGLSYSLRQDLSFDAMIFGLVTLTSEFKNLHRKFNLSQNFWMKGEQWSIS